MPCKRDVDKYYSCMTEEKYGLLVEEAPEHAWYFYL